MRRRALPALPVAKLAEAIQDILHPLRGLPDLDPLLERIGNARVVCLGEASHGTEEFYTWRTLNYVPTVLPRRYDAFLYVEETHALHPLSVAEREEMEVPKPTQLPCEH